jgi:carbon-monoxide dehydrogenase large subunit
MTVGALLDVSDIVEVTNLPSSEPDMDAKTGENHAYGARVEDDYLLRGAGRFLDDGAVPGQAYAYFVRSPHAFARIRSIDTEPARSAPGVLAVLTAADIKAAGIGSISQHAPMTGRGGAKVVVPPRLPLAADRVMHVGEPVVLVIGQTLLAAQDAAEKVVIDYEELKPVVGLRDAVRPEAPQLWSQAPGNMVLDWLGAAADPVANEQAVDAVFKSAAHVARVSVVNQRLVVATMEPRGATASHDAKSDTYLLRACSQSAGVLRNNVIAAMGFDKERLRVMTDDVGGAFGLKTAAYPEYPALLLAARMTGRPVHWMSNRAEAFLSDNQARDNITDAELALDDKGKFLALRIRVLANLGAYIAPPGAHVQTNNMSRCLPGMYRIPHIDAQVRCVFTNTLPVGPYRGAGRPEANYVLERLVAEAARVTGIEPAKLRRRNLIPPSAMPYKTPVGTTYDSGDFAAVLDKALALAGYDDFKQRRRDSAKRGKHRGIGLSCFLEHSGGAPLEGAALTFPGDGTIILGLNVQSTGQGHATVFPRLVAQRLGIKASQVHHRHGDSKLGIAGFPSVGSRSAMTAGSAIVRTIDVMLAKGRSVAAAMLEAADADIGYHDGHFEVVGTDRRVSLFEAAARAADLKTRGEIAESLDTKETTETPTTFPNGCHVAEVEVDPETGHVEVVGYAAVDDCGNVLDPVIVHGQLHGGVAMGIGQALMEFARYDPDSGQLISGSFMDYAMPRADDLPLIRDGVHSVPATTNPLGVKGVGEAGTTASIAAIMNAIADAIPGGGGDALDMPATAEKVWAACRPTA